MAYIPKSKQIVGGKLEGTLIDPKTGLQYNGKFSQDYLGNFYKGESANPRAGNLLYVPTELEMDQDKLARTYFSSFPKPTDRDYVVGSYTRYFLQDLRTGKIIEIDKAQYLSYTEKPVLYKKEMKVEWLLTGILEDTSINSYKYSGVRSKNQKAIEEAEKEMPGIGTQVLRDPAQYFKETS